MLEKFPQVRHDATWVVLRDPETSTYRREFRMPGYWLHYLREGRLVGWNDFGADSDETAVVYASELRSGYAAELWEGHRKVWSFEAHPEPLTLDKSWIVGR
jgi:hypothetical protein